MITKEKRDKLFHEHMSLAEKIASKKQKSVPKCVQLDELRSAAYYGLLDAASRYDESKHDQFPMYATIRIYGEINDYLRKCTWGTRGHQVHSWTLDVPVIGHRPNNFLNLSAGLAEKQEMNSIDTEDFFEDMMRCIPRRARRIMKMHFIDGLTIQQITFRTGFSEPRISQIISELKETIKKFWTGREDELWGFIYSKKKPEKLRLVPRENKIAA
jgi:RNA polymerase sigma factor (sigma-70 family)